MNEKQFKDIHHSFYISLSVYSLCSQDMLVVRFKKELSGIPNKLFLNNNIPLEIEASYEKHPTYTL